MADRLRERDNAVRSIRAANANEYRSFLEKQKKDGNQ